MSLLLIVWISLLITPSFGQSPIPDYSGCLSDSIKADRAVDNALNSYFSGDTSDNYRRYIDTALQIYTSSVDYEMISYCYTVLGTILYWKNEIHESLGHCQKAVSFIEYVKNEYPTDHLIALNNLAVIEIELEDYVSAFSRLNEIIGSSSFAMMEDDGKISVLRNIAMMEARIGDRTSAINYLNRLRSVPNSMEDVLFLEYYFRRELSVNISKIDRCESVLYSRAYLDNLSEDLIFIMTERAVREGDLKCFYDLYEVFCNKTSGKYWEIIKYILLLKAQAEKQEIVKDIDSFRIAEILSMREPYYKKHWNHLYISYCYYLIRNDKVRLSYDLFEQWCNNHFFYQSSSEIDMSLLLLSMDYLKLIIPLNHRVDGFEGWKLLDQFLVTSSRAYNLSRFLILNGYNSYRLNENLTDIAELIATNDSISLLEKWMFLAKTRQLSLSARNRLHLNVVRKMSTERQSTYLKMKQTYYGALRQYDNFLVSETSQNNYYNNYVRPYEIEYRKIEDSLIFELGHTIEDYDIGRALEKMGGGILNCFQVDSTLHLFFAIEGEPQTHITVQKNTFIDVINIYKGLYRPDATILSNNREFLYNLLFPPNIDWSEVEHLTIVPDGILHKLSFESLVVGFHEDGRPKYLIEEVPISYSLGMHLAREFEDKSDERLVAFAPSFDDEEMASTRDCSEEVFGSLYCNEEEVALVNEYMGGTSYTAEEATASNFKATIAEYDIFHLSTHACIDTANYYNSSIVLNDGQVTIADLYETDWYNKTVVLSACNTAGGKLVSGEGVFNFARTLTELGCKEVIVSLWPIDDCSTKDFISKFYEHKSEGLSSAKAMQQARIDYLNEADKLHAQPYFWAPLILISNDTSAGVGESIDLLYWIIALVVFLFIAGFFMINRSRKNKRR